MSTSARLRSKRDFCAKVFRRSRGDADVDIRAPGFKILCNYFVPLLNCCSQTNGKSTTRAFVSSFANSSVPGFRKSWRT